MCENLNSVRLLLAIGAALQSEAQVQVGVEIRGRIVDLIAHSI